MNKAATNIENARGPVVAVTAPNGSGQDRGRTLDCSALTPDGTHRAPSHRRVGLKRVRMEAWQEAFSLLRSFCLCFGHHVALDRGGLLMEAIWPSNTPHQSGLVRRPFGLFAGRSGTPIRKKSPIKEPRGVARCVLRKWLKGPKALSSWSVGSRHLDHRLWRIWVRGVSLSHLLTNGFHEKASLVKVNVVTKASTIQGETPFAKLPFALDSASFFRARCMMGSVRDGCCNLKCGLSFGPKPFAQSPPDTGRWAFPQCSSLLHSPSDHEPSLFLRSSPTTRKSS